MSKNVTAGGFESVKYTCQFDEDFMKNYIEYSGAGYFIESDVEYPKSLHDFHHDLRFLSKRMKIKKFVKLLCSLHNEKE